jgi:hypothetical protein
VCSSLVVLVLFVFVDQRFHSGVLIVSWVLGLVKEFGVGVNQFLFVL